MKKTKRMATSLLSLLLCGSLCFTAGCDLFGNGGDSSTGEYYGEEATVTEKASVYESILNTAALFTTEGQTLKITVDFDMEAVYGGSAVSAATDSTNTINTATMTMDGTAYYQFSQTEGYSVDATISGLMTSSELPYMYAGAHVRGDGVYYGAKTGTQAINPATVEYYETNLEDLLMMLMSQMPMSVEEETETETPALGIEQMGAMLEMIMPMVDKLASSAFLGLGLTTKTQGDVTTITLNVKQEISLLLTIMEAMANTIADDATVADLLANEQLKGLFNRYLGAMSAEDLYEVIILVAYMSGEIPQESIATMFPAPAKNVAAYDYLVSVLVGIEVPYGEEGQEAPTAIGDIEIGAKVKGDLLEDVAERKAMLEKINKCIISLQIKGDTLSGLSFSFDQKDAGKMSLSVGISAVTDYQFIDINTLFPQE